MQNTRLTEASPVLSVLAVQGGRVTGKATKERPKRDKRKRGFDDYLRKAGYESSFDQELEDRLADSIDTLA